MVKIKLTVLVLAVAYVSLQGCTKTDEVIGSPKAGIRTFLLDEMKTSASSSAFGTFYITNKATGKVLEILEDSMLNNGAKALQNKYNGTGIATGPNQKWYIFQQGTGQLTASTNYKIMNVASGKFLEVPGGSSAKGLQLQQNFMSDDGAQL